MNQMHKTDDYNFAQPSRTGRAGFESFKNDEDGRFYFLFNDAKGVPMLFSQAYQRDSTRDKGIQSVIKNAALEEQFERQNTEGGFYFILRAGNKQEIARSRTFKSLVELVQKQTYLRQNLSLNANERTSASPAVPFEMPDLEEKTAKPASGVSPALLKAENDELKEKIASLETKVATLEQGDNLADETLRHVFRIEIYKNNTLERLYGKIIHPFSDQTQTFTGFDKETIFAFMSQKMQVDLPAVQTASPQSAVAETTTMGQKPAVKPMAKPSVALEHSPVKAINLTNNSTIIQQNQPFALILTALPNERFGVQVGQPCIVEISAFNLDTHEKFKLLEKRSNVQADVYKNGFFVRIEPVALNIGSYRLSLSVRVLSNGNAASEDIQKWLGSLILQVYG